MITIQKPEVFIKDGTAELAAKVSIRGKEQTIWYRTAAEYAEHLCTERADAFLVALLPYAMTLGEDITSVAPVSAQLLHGLRQYEIPFMQRVTEIYKPVAIHAQADATKLDNAGHIGTGVSCGVDGLSTLIQHSIEEPDPNYRIDTLALFNAGHYGKDEGKSREKFDRHVAIGKSFCEENGYRFLQVDSNVGQIVAVDFTSAVSFLISSVILALQKYFTIYYFASTYSVFPFKPIYEDSETYDLMTTYAVGTENITIYSGCTNLTRVEKVDIISRYPELFAHVYPCVNANPPHNCGYCEKCRYTIMDLDVLGKLDMAEKAFDMTYYRKHRTSLYAFMLLHRSTSIDKVNAPLYWEIYNEMKRKGMHLPFGTRFFIPYQYYRAKIRLPMRHFLGKVAVKLLGKKRAEKLR